MFELKGYKILKQLGSGPISQVFLAREDKIDRPVLIKRLNPEIHSEQDLVERFRREAILSARLQHVNIVAIYDVNVKGDNLYLVSEFIDGIDLARKIKKHHPLPFADVLQITSGLLNGLEHAHQKGVVHRDIKPANIIIDTSGQAKIVDFGLATAAELPKLTFSGEVVGTPAYMSPEQIRGKTPDTASDIFSAGVTIYEMTGGENPFSGPNIAATMENINRLHPPTLTDIREDVPGWFSDLVAAMLDKAPEKRPTSPAKTIATEAAGSPATMTTTTGTSGQQQLPVSPSRWRGAAVTFAFLLLLGIVGFTGLRLLATAERHDAEPNPGTITTITPFQHNADTFAVDNNRDNKPPMPATAARPQDTKIKQEPVRTTELAGTVNSNKFQIEAEPAATSAQYGELTLIVSPWADVYDGERRIGTTPLQAPLTLTAGEHLLRFQHPQHHKVTRTISVAGGRHDTLIVELQPLVGFLNLTVHPWARVFVNDSLIGETPLVRPLALRAGAHLLRLEHPQFPVWQDSVFIRPQQVANQTIDLENS